MSADKLLVALPAPPLYQQPPWTLNTLERLAWKMGFTDGREGRNGETIPHILEKIRPHYTAGFTAGMAVRQLATPRDWRDTQPTTHTTALPTP